MEIFAGFLLFEAGEGPGTRKPGKQAVVGKRCEPLDKNTFHFKKEACILQFISPDFPSYGNHQMIKYLMHASF